MFLKSGECIELAEDIEGRKIYTSAELGCNGINMFGIHKIRCAQEKLDRHYHKNTIEFSFVKKGNVIFDIDNGSKYDLTGGDLLIMPANTFHSTNNQPMPLHNMYWFQLRTDSKKILNLNTHVSKSIISRLNIERPIKIRCNDNTFNILFQKAASLLPPKNELESEIFALTITNILYEILNHLNNKDVKVSSKIQQVKQYIDDHLTEKLELADLAKLAIMSESRFKQKFYQEIGTSPREYINHEKIVLATSMLKANKLITNIAYDLNFSSSSYFCVVFKKFTNYTPSEYIEMHKSCNI